ncbi:serine hydrolase [Ruminiclostridium cellulolyticum]|uniref:Beta-lactamase n=1 Tax=Ruminiclostridium cellulolyticum (strain ATCC 35319 / DSM 5812 / JCM 6584 / H10) TaxID=394503 RepID=B8I6Z0_RUMCH|nr:serine hydrolase [Ruminiclostridium cellulolyticum]ACL76982.1 beta-lactamase [Ruminiclostridium cellulolyticum H10]
MQINKTKKQKRILSVMLLSAFICICWSNTLAAQSANPSKQISNVSSTTSSDGPNDPKELEKFCDDFFKKYMEKDSVPGAIISVVKNGQILLKKGYGYADLKNKVPINPDKTAFYICSIGKLFTGTAVIQLYEKGKIKDLNDNVNMYLKKIKVNNKFTNPVTFSNLLTHTSGLDEGSVIGGASKTKDEILSYEDYLKMKLGSVLREPGSFTRYSNLGYNLLGYLVEGISEMPFRDYIKTNILEPLGMTNSTAGEIPDNLAIPYIFDGTTMQPSTSEINLPGLGEGCIYSTADDMAKFMIAHLQNGRYKEKSILKAETSKLMHTQQFTNNPVLPGMCYTFMQSYDNNQKAIKHEGGDASGYISTLYLLPEYNIGFFVEVNTLSTLPITFESEFLDHYFPRETGKVQYFAGYKQRNSDYTGIYRSYDDISVTTLLKVMALFSNDGEMKILNSKEGALFMHSTSFEGNPIATKLIQTGDLILKRQDDNSDIVFQKDKQGNTAYAFNNEPQKTFEKIHWYETRDFNFITLTACMLIFIFNIIGITFSFFRRKNKKKESSLTKLELASNATLWSVCMLNVISMIAFVLLLMTATYEIQYGLPLVGYISISGLLLGAVLSIGIIVFCVLLWVKRQKTLSSRIIYTISAISCSVFIWFLNYWNLLGFKLQ